MAHGAGHAGVRAARDGQALREVVGEAGAGWMVEIQEGKEQKRVEFQVLFYAVLEVIDSWYFFNKIIIMKMKSDDYFLRRHSYTRRPRSISVSPTDLLVGIKKGDIRRVIKYQFTLYFPAQPRPALLLGQHSISSPWRRTTEQKKMMKCCPSTGLAHPAEMAAATATAASSRK